MSIDIHSPSVAGFRCEAVTTETVALPCVHGKSANLSHIQSACLRHGSSYRDDPAVLIGLALACVRQGPLLDGLVPEPLMLRLHALAHGGNAACRLLLDWMRNRNRDLGRSPSKHLTRPAPVIAAAVDTGWHRRSPRERVLAKVTKLGADDGRRRGRTRPRDPVQNSITAIIAAQKGGRIDG
ncbi:hypothetical protein [Rhizobium sp. SRDI969]|uniref:hypothetical protein n=1 Tax=Rhizobium sp. SRDI969 TaxID=3138252 RepID=UPI0021A933D1|nr:hypothetical protein [Rhizobium leguminosarum]UWM82140.1 hypothetical protein N2A41_02360 [Rhizobium leguminosarum bv. viciae]